MAVNTRKAQEQEEEGGENIITSTSSSSGQQAAAAAQQQQQHLLHLGPRRGSGIDEKIRSRTQPHPPIYIHSSIQSIN